MTELKQRSLDEQREEFARGRMTTMPIAGTIVWAALGIAGAILPSQWAAFAIFIGTGSIFYLALLVARFTGEDLLGKSRPKNEFDRLFFLSTAMAWLVFAVAIPFYLVDHTSLPLTVGILTGLMWMPISWIIKHWVGMFHTISRTLLIVAAWYLFPDDRFVVIPAVIVAVYLVSIVALEKRWRERQQAGAA